MATGWSMVVPHSEVLVTLPPSNGGRQPIQAWVGPTFQQRASILTESCMVRFDIPRLFSCTNIGKPGQIMTIGGSNFGNGGEVAVRVGGSLCARAQVAVRHNQITCQIPEIPEGTGKNLLVTVCEGGQWSDSEDRTAFFSYKGTCIRASRRSMEKTRKILMLSMAAC
jgi:hypothetical protein